MNRRLARFVLGGLVVALTLAFVVSRYASSEPDGLSKVAVDQRLDGSERAHALEDGPFAGYSARGVDDPGLATGLAGVVGVLAVFAVAGGVVWWVARSSHPSRSNRSPKSLSP